MLPHFYYFFGWAVKSSPQPSLTSNQTGKHDPEFSQPNLMCNARGRYVVKYLHQLTVSAGNRHYTILLQNLVWNWTVMPVSGYQTLDIGKNIWCHIIFFEFHSTLTRCSKTLHVFLVFLVWKQSSSGAVFPVKNVCWCVLQWKQTHRKLTWATEMSKDHCLMKK